MYNLFREMLKDLPKGKIEIIPDDPKDQEISDQMGALINLKLDEYVLERPNETI